MAFGVMPTCVAVNVAAVLELRLVALIRYSGFVYEIVGDDRREPQERLVVRVLTRSNPIPARALPLAKAATAGSVPKKYRPDRVFFWIDHVIPVAHALMLRIPGGVGVGLQLVSIGVGAPELGR